MSEDDEQILTPEEEAAFDAEEYKEQLESESDKTGDPFNYTDSVNQPSHPDNLFKLFRDTWKTNNSTKVGNLNTQELGSISISIRGCQHLASLGEQFGHPGFANFFKTQAEITSSTSMAKKGWFAELFVSQRKYSQKNVGTPTPQAQQSKWSISSLVGGDKKPEATVPAI